MDEIPTDEVVIASWQRTADYWAKRSKRVEAENGRLRSALTEIQDVISGALTVQRPLLAVVGEIADAALDTILAPTNRPTQPYENHSGENDETTTSMG